ncbi:hypothetical protein CI109_101148 [Kwoniella shandongensis]|uniref:Uncharacterized protein n=1 Tax=Kwoniella shandongensis TaxID=1734106 RepID=A0A5M6C641_9TREE|nr:uncharacterized protein CI109_001617 [Kwoniella shandongensis]KAA5530210.1 hypothetical protein CI109_001617 [Kwoniella shandongensis]
MTQKHLFAAFDVSRQVFYRSPISIGIVNLKPLLPGHVLIIPRRVVPRLADLEPREVTDLFLAVQHVGKVLEEVYKAQALTVSLQDGAVAGQSVPHVHIHLIPRHPTDYSGNNDEIYPALERSEAALNSDLKGAGIPQVSGNGNGNGSADGGMKVPKDEDRRPRTIEEMEEEAEWLSGFFTS